MPNWVNNTVVLDGPQTEYIFKNIFNEGKVDFNDIIPMPSDIFTGALGREEQEKYGEKNWYDWSCQNWGTKWNAMNAEPLGTNGVSFETAWSMPEPIFKEISRRFPDMSVRVLYADEDRGSNCGFLEYKNGNGQTVEFCKALGISEELCDYFLAMYVWGDSVEETAEYHDFGMKIKDVECRFNEFCVALENYLNPNKNKEET